MFNKHTLPSKSTKQRQKCPSISLSLSSIPPVAAFSSHWRPSTIIQTTSRPHLPPAVPHMCSSNIMHMNRLHLNAFFSWHEITAAAKESCWLLCQASFFLLFLIQGVTMTTTPDMRALAENECCDSADVTSFYLLFSPTIICDFFSCYSWMVV